MAAATVRRIEQSHASKDPVVQFGSITADGGVLLSGSTQAIPASAYTLAPDVLASHPNLTTDDQVVVVWADRGAARRPVVTMVLSAIGSGTGAVTGVVAGDGSIATAAGDTITPDQVAYSEAMRARVPPASTAGTNVIGLWCDVDATRMLRVIAVV